jgi:diguanylate cyclase (GGDEF)-like protein
MGKHFVVSAWLLSALLSISIFAPTQAVAADPAAIKPKPREIPVEVPGDVSVSKVLIPVETPAPVDKSREETLTFVTVALLLVSIAELSYIILLRAQYRKVQEELQAEIRKQGHITTQMEHQALYDPLTQLPNRRLFKDRILYTIKTANRQKSKFGILMADLDHFKEVNDTLGHDAGDLLLIEVTTRLREAIRDSDTVARLGGDEFAFICPSIQDMKTASLVCMRLIQAFQEPIVVKGKPFQIGISLGVALFPEHAQDDEMLLRRADTALYRAKQKRNTFVMYDGQIDRPATNKTDSQPS